MSNRGYTYCDVSSVTVAAVYLKSETVGAFLESVYLLIMRIIVRDRSVVAEIGIANKVVTTCNLETRAETSSERRVVVVNPSVDTMKQSRFGRSRVSKLNDNYIPIFTPLPV